MTHKLAGCTFGWLHRAPLADALRSLSAAGVRTIELTTAPPHLFTRHLGPYERMDLARLLRALGLGVVSLNPSFADINLISTNPEIRAISERQLTAEIELAADLSAQHVVVIPGRRHALAPAPDAAAKLAKSTSPRPTDVCAQRARQVSLTWASPRYSPSRATPTTGSSWARALATS